MTQRLTASVIGCGLGGKLSMKGLANSDRYHLVAAADLGEAARQQVRDLYPEIRVFASHQEMLQTFPTDVVCVSTWAPSHKQVTLDVLATQSLKGILVEKPLGDTAEPGREILRAIKARNLPMAVPHNLLVAKHAGQVLQHLRDGDIGELKLIEIENTGWDIINAGIHWLNYAVTLLRGEEIAWVLAACDTSTRTWRDGMQVETLAVTYVQTRSGKRIVMNTGDEPVPSTPGRKTNFRLIGTAGMIEFWGWESAYTLTNHASPGGQRIEVAPSSKTGHQMHLENLADQIASGKPDYAVAESSLMALELCEAAYVSHRHRCAVTFPFPDFVPPEPTDWDPGRPYSGAGGGRDGRQFG